MARYWIGVAVRAHVKRGEAGGFCQLGHGKAAPVARLAPGDGLVYYAPRETLDGKDPVQAFVAIGRVKSGDVYRADQGGGFHPHRRDVTYLQAREAPIRPLLDHLSFIGDPSHWGMPFRRGSFEIPQADFLVIAKAMGVADSFAEER